MPTNPTSHEYKATVGLFATGVTVLTCRDGDLAHGMTASAFASVSLDPLLVLVCVRRDAVMRKVMEEVGRFAVSVLAADQERLARWFSDSTRPAGLAQFDTVGWRPGGATGAPLLSGALAWLECETDGAFDGGDHLVFVGRVLRVERSARRDPLLYFSSGYRRLDGGHVP